MKAVVAAFSQNRVFANILMMLIIFGGVLAATNMLREIFPEFSVDIVTVSVAYPGFDPEEVEEGISRKLEAAVEGLEGIKRFNSTSVENVAALNIEVYEDYDLFDVKNRIETAINGIPNLPVASEKPIINEVTIRGEVVVLSISGPLSERQMKEWAEDLKDEIQTLPGITQVDIQGTRKYEIAVEVSEDRLREYGLSLDDVAAAVQRNNTNVPAGTLRTKGEEVRLRTVGRKYTGKEFSEIVLFAGRGGEFVTLDRVAEINDGFEQNRIISKLNGSSALNILVYKTREEDMIAIANTMNAWVAEKNPTLPAGYDILVWSDNSIELQGRISLLVRNGALGLTLVFFLLWLFLDLRLSFWATMGIPISLGGGLAIMWMLGATLNMISLFGLIMVLGIIVDDAIVVGEAIYVRRRQGDGPLNAAVNGTMEVGLPVVAAVTTSIIAFVPLMFVNGVMGKFIAILPVAVICALVISLVECLVLLPAHLGHLPDPHAPQFVGRPTMQALHRFRLKFSDGLVWFIDHLYGPFLKTCVRYRYVVACVAVSVMMATAGLMGSGMMKFLLFPNLDGNDIIATVEFPSGTPIETTEKAVAQLEDAFLRIRDRELEKSGRDILVNRYTMAGASMSGGMGSAAFGRSPSGSNVGSMRIKLLESTIRKFPAEELMVMWEHETGLVAGATSLVFQGLQQGPPGSAIEVWVKGPDLNQIILASEELKHELRTYEGAYQVRSDYQPGKNELRLKLKPEARALGLTVEDLGRQARSGYYGNEVLRLQRGRDDIRVKIRYTKDERSRVSDFENIRIRTQQGDEVPLISVANIEYGPGYSTIQRSDGVRRVQVNADVDTKRGNTTDIVNAMQQSGPNGEPSYFEEMEQKYPGVEFSFQGAINDARESLGSLMVGFPMALLGIFVVIATIFKSYLQPFVIMFTVPFGIIGAIWGHFAFGYDLQMMSIFGIVALSGVVVNDAIVFIESFNTIVASGVPLFDAIVQAGRRRFRAIFLTTISTCGGLAPIIFATDPQAVFLIPMALSIACGVAFATLLTLVLIPCMLGMLNDLRRIGRRIYTGNWPTPEEVEPARIRNSNPFHQPALEPQVAK